MYKTYLSENLKLLRNKNGEVQQKAFAQIFGFSAQKYNNYEMGLSNPSFIDLKKLAEYHSVSVDDLVYKDLSKTKTPLNSEEVKGGNRFEEKEDVISLLREIRDEQKELSISYRTISDALLKDHNMPADKDPTLTTEQITAAVQQMIDQGTFAVKQSDLSQEELKELSRQNSNISDKHGVKGKSEAVSSGKGGKHREQSAESQHPSNKGAASRK